MQNKPIKKPLIITCSLCNNYQPNTGTCQLSGEKKSAFAPDAAAQCKDNGDFIRYLHVLPDAFNLFTPEQDISVGWRVDDSKVPTDERGVPLTVYTKRGLERALPADESVTMIPDPILGVPRIQTYQGQREIIYELGVTIAQEVAEKEGIPLTVLADEQRHAGVETFIQTYLAKKDTTPRKTPWLSDGPVKEW